MAKISGGVRTLRGGSKEFTARQSEVQQLENSGLYSSVEFSKKGGGYVAVEKSPYEHKPEELEAARFLADKGNIMKLKNEAGNMRTPDGYVFNYSFEQITPKGDTAQNFRNALNSTLTH